MPTPANPPKGDGPRPESEALRPDTSRLAKVIARAGRASRRSAERLIADGKVTVDGVTVYHPGHPVDPSANRIEVEGQVLPARAREAWFAFYKPKGVITTRSDPGGRRTVTDMCADLPVRVEPVGRLDIDTEGILLLTNNGAVAHRLLHPSTHAPKRYMAKCWKRPDERDIQRLENGVDLEDGRTAPARVRVMESTDAGNCWIEITVTEGRNRMVRRMFETIGHPLSKLRRESFATISLSGLERGGLRALTGDEVRRLHEIAEGRDPREAGHGTRYKKGFARPKPPKNRPLSRARHKKGE